MSSLSKHRHEAGIQWIDVREIQGGARREITPVRERQDAELTFVHNDLRQLCPMKLLSFNCYALLLQAIEGAWWDNSGKSFSQIRQSILYEKQLVNTKIAKFASNIL